MAQHYCHQCAMFNSLVSPVSPSSLIDTCYKFGKFMKHTAPSASAVYPVNSFFDDPTYHTYENYVVTTAASGFLEIDDCGRKNLIWYAGSRIGAEYHGGMFVAPTEGVKLVLSEDDSSIHAFSIGASPSRTGFCDSCGKPVPFW